MIMMAVKIALSERKELMACETIEIDGLLQKANKYTPDHWQEDHQNSKDLRYSLVLGLKQAFSLREHYVGAERVWKSSWCD